jgi:hypothetical protein
MTSHDNALGWTERGIYPIIKELSQGAEEKFFYLQTATPVTSRGGMCQSETDLAAQTTIFLSVANELYG